jgi:ABC-type lipoprotein release transport system permease subunit
MNLWRKRKLLRNAETEILEELRTIREMADPAVMACAAGVLGLVALCAAWLPARRAAHLDPMAALRHE